MLLPFGNVVLFMCNKRSKQNTGSSATSSHQQRCYIISQEDFKGLHSNLLYVTTMLSFCYQIPDELLLTTLVFNPASFRRVGLEGKLCGGELLKLDEKQSSFCVVEAKVCIVSAD